ncbi:molybdenum cofactor guanylyltransferase [Aestuariivivens insulae]|uniref:molybdenum cofactor guanylyltransferase n=1 Tax=Aestuariivivens insulae TaxID=1621988 RepID=UPI001F57EE5F|nr:molybdenum cofactor guanylyltransferase [Aestuariivivens insulae]
MVEKKHITGIVLAGGKSTRMGTDKGLMEYNQKPFVQYCIDALKPLVSEIIIVSDHSGYDVFGYERIEDNIKNAGPLAGVYSGLKHSKTAYNLVLSCDVPLIKTAILKQLIDASEDTIEIIQIESDNRTMPLIALYKKDCSSTFYNLLQQGEKRLQYAVNQCAVKTISLKEEEQVYTLNINTKEEFKTIQNEHHH